VADVCDSVAKPVAARQDRSLRAALDYVAQHYAEPLRLPDVARVAGFAPSHFSKLFILRERMPFSAYVRRLRLERAKFLLTTTELGAKRVAELSGFGSVYYFTRVFHEELGVTPAAYRRKKPKSVTGARRSPGYSVRIRQNP
jgi:transcriptional regulator GlxA family with amidase domain